MSDNIIDHGCNKLQLCLAWETFATNTMYWEEGQQGAFFIGLLLKFSGREPCERVALYWNQHGRDDIAMKIKSIIHQGEKTP
jgi:hypothetical protein